MRTKSNQGIQQDELLVSDTPHELEQSPLRDSQVVHQFSVAPGTVVSWHSHCCRGESEQLNVHSPASQVTPPSLPISRVL